MSKNLPAPLQPQQPARPPVVVLDGTERRPRASAGGSLARFLLNVTPDLLRVVERSVEARNAARSQAPVQLVQTAQDRRIFTSGMSVTEYDVDMRLPFVRHLTVRRASAWATDAPYVAPDAGPEPARGGRLRRAGLMSVGGALALAALGLVARGTGATRR
jgi:hypothetical protein